MVIKSPIRLTNFLFFQNSQYYFLEKDWTKLADHNEEIVPIPAKLYSLNKDGRWVMTSATNKEEGLYKEHPYGQ